MPRISTIPNLYDDAHSISISDLRKWGYLKPNTWRSGNIRWSRHGRTTSSVSIFIDMYSSQPYLRFDYTYQKEEEIKYDVPLVSLPSNLGKGRVWYFLCPAINKRCRKLYRFGKYFLHREAFNAVYEKQTYSGNNRALCQMAELVFGSDKLYEELYSKHFKKYYAGKPTKRYIKMMKKIQKAEKLTQSDVEGLYFGVTPNKWK